VHGTAFFAILGLNRRTWLYPDLYYRAKATQMPEEMSPDADLLAYAQLKFSLADRVEWDEQGRFVVPERVLRRIDMKSDVTLVGVYDHLELWQRADWVEHNDLLEKNSVEIEAKGKQAMKLARVLQ
jgi:MraZ protein